VELNEEKNEKLVSGTDGPVTSVRKEWIGLILS
jgi:hypothetical protein